MKHLIPAVLLLVGSLLRLPASGQSISASGPTSLVAGEVVTLTASSGYSAYQWTRNNVEDVGIGPTYVARTPGYYRVKGTNGGTTTVSSAVAVFVRGAGSTGKNLLQEEVVLSDAIRSEADLDLPQTKKDRTITYLDGLLRPVQQVAVQASPGNRDVVQLHQYTATGQEVRQFLPYTSGTDGSFKTNALADQQAFYSTTGAAKVARVASDATYAESIFTDTPSADIIEQGAPGSAWQIAKDGNGQSTFQGHTKRVVARGNGGGELAAWSYTPGAQGSIGTASFGFPAANQVLVTRSTDEDGKVLVRYRNYKQQLLASELETGTGEYLTTCYAYDGLGRTVMILSPEGVMRAVNRAEQVDAAFLGRWAYLYQYDERGRPIGKKVPGQDWLLTVYDHWDRPVATQDGVQRQANKWSFKKYDELNRVIITGQFGSSRTRQQLADDIEQGVAAGTMSRFEAKASVTTAGLRLGYTITRAWPTTVTGAELYVVSYYDDYSFLDGSQAPLQYQQEAASDLATPSAASTLTVGLATITQTRVLGSSVVLGNTTKWLTSVTYYDDKARVLQTKRESLLGAVERTSTAYDYTNKTTHTYLSHRVSASGPAHTIRYRYTYDDNGNLLSTYGWFNKSTGTTEILLAKKEYNELGQLVDDKLGEKAAGQYLQSVDYRYNARGWLTSLNNRDLLDLTSTNEDADAEIDLFGLDLKYESDLQMGSTVACYNGNVAESLWKSRRDMQLRGYAYRYDNINRLTDAKYAAYGQAGSSWGWQLEKDDTGGLGRFTTSGIRYDQNGNIQEMNRVGRKVVVSGRPQFGPIDQLRYSYDGNRLRSVVDQAGTSDAPNDFEDVTPSSGDDYSYDANGRMTSDANKQFSLVYNELNLLSQVNKGSDQVSYLVYSATGQKLAQYYYSPGNNWNTTYVGDFVYGKNQALSVTTPTGRALYATTSDNATKRWLQEYHLRDQLGNLRLAFRDEGNTVQNFRATMESAQAAEEEEHFDQLAATRELGASHARTGSYAARLNAGQSQRMMGPSTAFQVSAGDSVHFEVYGRYDQPKSGMLPAVGGALASVAVRPLTSEQELAAPKRSLFERLSIGIAVGLTAIPHLWQRKAEVPRASVKYDFYDQDSVLVASQVKYLDREAGNNWQQLEVGFRAKQAGYVVVSIQNATRQDVWFDDALLRTSHDMIVQENHYDPWGQNLLDIELQGTPDCKQQFGNQERLADMTLEWTDHGARMLDTQLGRWHVADPADQFSSPYVGLGNNPIAGRDPDGQFWHLVIGAVVGGVINVATHWDKIHGFGDGAMAFGIGAVGGLVTAAVGGGAAYALKLGMASIGGGVVAGTAGAIAGSPVQGIGNSAYFGDEYGIRNFGQDVLTGAVMGGISGAGANLYQNFIKGNHLNFWSGRAVAYGRNLFSFNNTFNPLGDKSIVGGVGVRSGVHEWPNGRVIDGTTGEILYEDPTLARAIDLDMGNQGKHLLQAHNYIPGRSVVTADVATLANDIHSGNFELFMKDAGRGPVLKFDRMVGEVLDKSGVNLGPTPYLKLHVKANGLYHLVPWMPAK